MVNVAFVGGNDFEHGVNSEVCLTFCSSPFVQTTRL